MSTFTRLYFVNRGPSIADDDPSEPLQGREVGSPEIAPVEAIDDPDREYERFEEPTYSRLPQRRSPLLDRWGPATRRDSQPDGDPDLEF